MKGVTGVSGNQFTAGSTVIVVGQIIVVVVFQFQVQMPTRRVFPFFPLLPQRSSLFFGHDIHPHYSKTPFNSLSSTKLVSEIN